jgi:hypothetical protein
MKPGFDQDRLRQAPDRVQPRAKNLVGAEGYRGGSAQINTALKSWFDNVIIPNLIKLYLSEHDEPEAAQGPTLAGSGKQLYTRPDSERKQ